MDFDLTDEQVMMRDTVRRYLKEKIVPIADEYDRKGPMSKEDAHKFLKELKPFGYLGTLVPEDLGGMGLTHMDWAILYEELRAAYASLGGIAGITSSGTRRIAESENTAVKDRILPGLLAGDTIICSGITEPNVGSDAAGIETRAVLDGDHYIINGTKSWISNGSIADYCVAVASIDRSKGREGLIHILVDKEESPFEVREIHKLGVRSFPTAELYFVDCRVPKENLLRVPGEGFKQTVRGLTFARANAAIASVGIAQAAIDTAVQYAKERTQFGRPIGKFQLIQQMIAEMVAEVDASRLLTYRAFYLMDKNRPCMKEASIAKAYATEAACRITSKALQIHGAYGLSEEYTIERYFRDARCYTMPDGTTEIQQLIVGREMLGMSAFV